MTGSNEHVRRMAGLPSDVIDPRRHGRVFETIAGHTPQSVLDRLSGTPGITQDAAARLLKGKLSKLYRHYGGTLGQSHIRRTGRGALGLAAAGLPAFLGTFLTNESN
jgi:hypothetical protein